ncbi:hypothetical protein [Variovorax sp. E3]|nr:hypothetical protein [Variovorax sp. E3]
MLVSTYPVDAVTRLRGYWVTLVPRASADADADAGGTPKNISAKG